MSWSRRAVCGALVAAAAGPGLIRAQEVGVRDLTLRDAAARALSTHPSVGIASAERARAQAAIVEAAAAGWPRLGVDATGTRFQEPMIVAPLHGFDPRDPPEFDHTLVQGRLALSWTLFDGGARGARVARTRGIAAALGAAEVAARTGVLMEVARAYFRVLAGRDLLAAHGSQVTALDAEHTRVERLFAAGRSARVAVLRAAAARSLARAAEAGASAALEEAESELARLVGVQRSVITAARLRAVYAVEPDPRARDALIRAATESNAAVARARGQLLAAEAGRSEARSAYLPVLGLASGVNAFGSAGGESITEWQAALQLSYPLFTGGGRGGAVRRAEAEVDAARHGLRLAELDVAAEVDRALTALAEATARADALAAAVTQSEAVVDVEQLALTAGAGVQTDFLRAQSELLEARANLADAQYAETLARIALARATGELTLDWLEQMLEERS